MEKISKFDLSSALEDCIASLQSGKNLEETLKKYPEYANELRPLVETAFWMHSAANQQPTITHTARAAQARSRMDFIRGANAPASKRPLFTFMHLRLATSLVIFAVLVFGVLGTHLAAVSALPGDPFYPVKLAIEQVQVDLASNSEQRIQLMENYDQRRAEEVGRLKNLGRQVAVDFTGTLKNQNGSWFVAGIRLIDPADIESKLISLQNSDVEVKGFSDGENLAVKEIYVHTYNFKGTIQKIQADTWTVDGITIITNDDTEISGQAVVGSSVDLSIHRLDNGQLIATQVNVNDPPQVINSIQPTSTQSHIDRSPEPNDNETEDPSNTPKPAATRTTPAPLPSKTADRGDDNDHPRSITATATPYPTRSEEHDSTRTPAATQTKTRSSGYKTATPTSDEEHYKTSTPAPTREH